MKTEIYGAEQLLEDLAAYTCPVHGCEAALSGNVLMCRGHWRLVHADQKREVFEAVRRLNRIGKRYDQAEPGSPRQVTLADSYLAEEIIVREIQLRAVILAGERAGARPEPVRSPAQSTPGKGGSMQIKITNDGDGCTNVAIVNPATSETIDTRVLNAGEQVTVTAVNAHEASDLEVGEVASAAGEAPAPEGEAPVEGGESGEGEGCADGEGESKPE